MEDLLERILTLPLYKKNNRYIYKQKMSRMSTFSDLPSSRPVPGRQVGQGFFSSLGKVFKKAPILSTAASLLPGPAKIAAPILASQGLGKGRGKGRGGRGSQKGGIKLKKLGKAVLPLLKKSGVLGELAGRVPGKKGTIAQKALKSQGFGKGRGRRGGRRVVHN
tara:strand:+ start:923 stop:1414 length:492 start_codon:yes stop_codon:yes gene_type:complete